MACKARKAHKAHKDRLDKLLVDRGLVESRTRAQALIMAGHVRVNGIRALKAGTQISPDCVLEVESGQRWASRGAFKLLRAFELFPLDVAGRAVLDLGASTGGFTDVLLDKGARKVYAVDVGYGQLLWRLASDPRVVVLDRTNARNLTPAHLDETPERAVCDASFISLKLLLPVLDALLPEDARAVVLIKPQFEAGRERLGRRGVVRDPEVHVEILEELLAFIGEHTGFCVSGLSWSPIRGPEGNVEFLCFLTRPDADTDADKKTSEPSEPRAVVVAAHAALAP
ncbi:MAG: TlyA family RNA methyltransferase [Fretibacterium sp.]|nr:TlyA family RNA methyltransferase [Fretibacterium sp.]